MGLSALGNQHRSKLTVQTKITSKSVAVLAFESSHYTIELKFESRLVGRVDEFVVMVRMVEIKRCTLHGDVKWDRRAEMGNMVWLLLKLVLVGLAGWGNGQEVSDGVRRKLQTEDDSSRVLR
jgi:hypothetical protein